MKIMGSLTMEMILNERDGMRREHPIRGIDQSGWELCLGSIISLSSLLISLSEKSINKLAYYHEDIQAIAPISAIPTSLDLFS